MDGEYPITVARNTFSSFGVSDTPPALGSQIPEFGLGIADVRRARRETATGEVSNPDRLRMQSV